MNTVTNKLRSDIQLALADLNHPDSLHSGAVQLLTALGYSSQKTLSLPNNPIEFALALQGLTGKQDTLHSESACLGDWSSVSFLFQLTNDELPALAAGQASFLSNSQVQAAQIQSFLFIAIDLKPCTVSRTKLAGITREINRLFPMPVIVLFRHRSTVEAPAQLSIAIINRRTNKLDETKDVVEGKVSIIKDITLSNPHAAHIRILEDMALHSLNAKQTPSNFKELYKAWMQVLDVKALNEKFYKELADWYYWAILSQTGVVFPKGQPLDKSNDETTKDRPTVAMIRLLTRLIFVWFLKEKQLVPRELFDSKTLAVVLKESPADNPSRSNYYKAILQNLFFATLNTETTSNDEEGNPQRVWRATSGYKHSQKYLIHTVYRYKDAFKTPDVAIELFKQVPFLNGGLFECLDRLVTTQDVERDPSLAHLTVQEGKQTVLRVDGFSEREDNPLHIPNELFFSEGAQGVDLNAVYQTKNRKYAPRGIIKIFERYKFTIEENTPIEEEVALDPELLGKVFENLLASYNEDTKSSARKKSGSFYTPREVVDYMVDEALIVYFQRFFPHKDDITEQNDPGSETAQTARRLRHLLSFRQTGHDFNARHIQTLMQAIGELRVLDPACGSGAYPMGMLQKLVAVLRKLDPDNALWKAQNRAPLEAQLAAAKLTPSPSDREDNVQKAQDALERFDHHFADNSYADYARKLYLIEKCIYGVDKQPVAVQIAKLRFFISLVVEQQLDPSRRRELTPLPNLETKIVTADTLLPIPRSQVQANLLSNPDIAEKEKDLREANASHFTAKRFADKRKRKNHILKLRDELADLLKADLLLAPSDAQRMSAWDPFDQNIAANFFDPEWMYGMGMGQDGGFDIVIGNPPYVRQEAFTESKPLYKPHYHHTDNTADLYVYFYERSFQLLRPQGVLSFITSNKWFRAKYGAKLRQFMRNETQIHQIIDFGDEAVFDALAYPTIVIASKRSAVALKAQTEPSNTLAVLNWDSRNEVHRVDDFPLVFATEQFLLPQSELKKEGWQLEPQGKRDLLARIRKAGQPLGDYCKGKFYRGVLTGLNDAFVISREQRDKLIAEDAKSIELIKPYLRGRDIKRWTVENPDLWLIFTRRGVEIESYSAIKKHLMKFKVQLTPKPNNWDDQVDGGWPGRKGGSYEWFHIQDNIAYWESFEVQKVIFPDIALSPQFAWDNSKSFIGNTAYIIPTHEKWLLAVLNSTITRWFYAQVSPQIQNGYYRFIAQYVEQIPIPQATERQKTVLQDVVQLIDVGYYAPEFERLLNGLVYELFFPTELRGAGISLFESYAETKLNTFLNQPLNQSAKEAELIKIAREAAVKTIFKNTHPIYGMLFDLQVLDVVRTIEGLD